MLINFNDPRGLLRNIALDLSKYWLIKLCLLANLLCVMGNGLKHFVNYAQPLVEVFERIVK